MLAFDFRGRRAPMVSSRPICVTSIQPRRRPKPGQAEAVEQRRPEEFPGVGKLDQREEADGLQIDALAAQPGRQQVEQQVERQARGKTGEDADQHLPVRAAQRARPASAAAGQAIDRQAAEEIQFALVVVVDHVAGFVEDVAFADDQPICAHNASKSSKVKKRTFGESYHW